MLNAECPICDGPAKALASGDAQMIKCSTCGQYKATKTAIEIFQHMAAAERTAALHDAQRKTPEGELVTVTSANIA